MSQNQQLEEALSRHPCYNRDAHREFARMHVPVAPRCNIQCNYCNRKYDCCNESRPGVTSEVLTPEQAAEKGLPHNAAAVSMVAFEEGQRRYGPSVTSPVEDPSAEPLCSEPNARAYSDDARAFSALR